MTPRPHVTILVHRDDELESHSIRLPLWLARILVWLGLALGAAIILGFAFYIPLARTAAQVPGLRRQVAQLQSENARINELASALDSAEARYGRLRRMVGADILPGPAGADTVVPDAPAVEARAPGAPLRATDTTAIPRHWPLDEPGYLTRGQVGAGAADESHPGVDVAVPVGSVVRAAAAGTVAESGLDPQYGNFVLIQHANDYQTMYGHLSRILTQTGAVVTAGQVIGLSGNTGRSSAPHLHFEIRQRGTSLDPLTLVKENN